MRTSLEFLLGLLDQDEPVHVAQEDFEGEHADALRTCRDLGFLGGGPRMNPVASCPYCDDGIPYRLGRRLLCGICGSTVDNQHLQVWPVNREACLRWLAGKLQLRGHVRCVEERLWQLGTLDVGDELFECFYYLGGPLSELGRTLLAAYRHVVVFYGLARPPEAAHRGGRAVSLLEFLQVKHFPTMADVHQLLRPHGNVRFDADNGMLWVGDVGLGEVPVGSKEFFFLRHLADNLDHFVPYAELKGVVLRDAGSQDTTEEATFCQGLKSRIKKKWVPTIDRLIATTNKADGYRLRGHAEQ